MALTKVSSGLMKPDNNLELEFTSQLGTTSVVGAATGYTVRTNYYDSNVTSGSGATFKFTGVTTLGKAGNVPNADGYFYDAVGRQFAVVGGRVSPLQFGATSTISTTAVQAAIAAAENRILSWDNADFSIPFGAVTVSAAQRWEGPGSISNVCAVVSGEIEVAATGLVVEGMNISFSTTDLFVVSTSDIERLTIQHNTITRTSGDFEAVRIQSAAVYNLVFRFNRCIANNSAASNGECVRLHMDDSLLNGFDVSDNLMDGWSSGFRSSADDGYTRTDQPSYFERNTVSNSTDSGAFFYHTSDMIIRNNSFFDNAKGTWIDAADVVDGNTWSGTTAVPSTLPPSDGTVADLSVTAEATAFRVYNGGTGEACYAVMLYNAANSFTNNRVIDNAWDGVVISVDSFKDDRGMLEGNEILRNGRHGYFISPLPRGDSWGGSRRIYAPVIQGGKIAGNGGHAVCSDGRYVESDFTVSYVEVRAVMLKNCMVYENGAVGWYDEDGVQSSIMRIRNVKDLCHAHMDGVSCYSVVQGSGNVQIHGLYYTYANSALNNSEIVVTNCRLEVLTGQAVYSTQSYGTRIFTGNHVLAVANITMSLTVNGGVRIVINNTDENGYRGYLTNFATWNPNTIANLGNESTTVTVTGAELGDYVEVSFDESLQGMTLTGYVSAADTVTARLENHTGVSINLASGALRAKVQSGKLRDA